MRRKHEEESPVRLKRDLVQRTTEDGNEAQQPTYPGMPWKGHAKEVPQTVLLGQSLTWSLDHTLWLIPRQPRTGLGGRQ